MNTGKQLKEYHKKKIMYQIAVEKGCSRAELANYLNVSKMSISMLVKELMEEGVLEEKQAAFNSNITGPKPRRIQIVEGQIVALAVFLTSEYVYAKLVDLNGTVHYFTRRIILKSDYKTELLQKIIEVVEDVKTACGKIFSTIIGVAVSTKHNSVVTGEEIKTLLESNYPFQIHNLDHTQMSAYAEVYDGTTYKRKKGIYIYIDDEVKGVLIDKKSLMYSGESMLIDLAHMSIKFDGSFCHCGNRGCFESYVCKNKLFLDSDCTTVDELCKGLEQRVPNSVRALEGFIQACDVGFSNIIQLLKVDYIVLAGYVTKLDRMYIKQIENMVNSHSIKDQKLFVKIHTSKLSLEQQISGLAISVFERYYFNKERRLP